MLAATLADAWLTLREISARAGGDPGFPGLSGPRDCPPRRSRAGWRCSRRRAGTRRRRRRAQALDAAVATARRRPGSRSRRGATRRRSQRPRRRSPRDARVARRSMPGNRAGRSTAIATGRGSASGMIERLAAGRGDEPRGISARCSPSAPASAASMRGSAGSLRRLRHARCAGPAPHRAGLDRQSDLRRAGSLLGVPAISLPLLRGRRPAARVPAAGLRAGRCGVLRRRLLDRWLSLGDGVNHQRRHGTALRTEAICRRQDCVAARTAQRKRPCSRD